MPLFVLPKAPLISTAVSGKVWEGPRCRLSQGWQLGAVLTCSLIKSSWARVHLWQGLCQAADRWEAVLNTNVTPNGDRQKMHYAPPAAQRTAVIQYLIYDMTQAGGVRAACLLLLISPWLNVHGGLLWLASEKAQLDKVFCAGWGGAVLVIARILPLFICIGADLPTGVPREGEGPFLKWVTG